MYFIKDRCLLNAIKLGLSHAIFVLACVLEKKIHVVQILISSEADNNWAQHWKHKYKINISSCQKVICSVIIKYLYKFSVAMFINCMLIIAGLLQPRPPDKIFYKFSEKNCESLQ